MYISNKNILQFDEIKDIVGPIAKKYKVNTVYLFGSYARGDATPESDIDLLVFGGEGFKKTLIFSLAEDLREAFGKPVDVYEIQEINEGSAFYKTILSERRQVA